ncbi:BQ5605_C051g12532 [Microbotryum silenes-dioicae]|uniref:BQ5605_C051g12532 protein n=1 Tax=Microbotryum silenes-dioicae TaxID=796604 RepID=A0A2X0PNW5_9BASI|nr:BQ5605_C051g12532 [Microbotryum silenes-dioicae]
MHLQVLNDFHHSNTMSSNPSSTHQCRTRPRALVAPPDAESIQPTSVTYHAITTNNYIESWHKILKYSYRQEISLIVTGFVRRRSSKAETRRQNTAQSIEWSRANDMVTEMDDDGDIYVASFGEDEQEDEDSTFVERSYTVGLNPTDSSVISTCDCPDFVRHMFPCKHMLLAARVTRRRSLAPPLQAIPNNTAEHEDRIQLYRRFAGEAGRVHAKLLRILQELEADKCDPHTAGGLWGGRGFHRGRQVSDGSNLATNNSAWPN